MTGRTSSLGLRAGPRPGSGASDLEGVRVLEYGRVALQGDFETVGRVVAEAAVDAPGVPASTAVEASCPCYQSPLS